MFKRKTYAFDDVLLVPQRSDIQSRSEVDLSTVMASTEFSLPIISSPMDTVTEVSMAHSLSSLGGFGIVHRYNSVKDQVKLVTQLRKENTKNISAAVGVTGDYEERACALYDAGAKIICIDVAHGHHTLVERAIKTLRNIFGADIDIIAGNVATPNAFEDLSEWGADAVRVGIGGGSICNTRVQTGHGVPTLQSVFDCRDAGNAAVIADGGIRTAGDIVKCLAAGADFVILGSLLAGTDQSPGNIFVKQNGGKYKVYRGMASREAQKDWRGVTSSLEGVSTTIPYKGCVMNVVAELAQNIRSGLSYSGSRSIREFQFRAEFIVQSGASQMESATHIMDRK